MNTEIHQEIIENVSGLSHLDPLLQRIYTNRGIKQATELQRELAELLPFSLLANIDKACERLYQAIQHQEKIIIIGDFDADGATSSALAVSALKQFGAQHVEYLVPNRFTYGYGLTPEIVDVAAQRAPNLLITVDNGIASIAGVEHARQLAIDVIITDHHLPAARLPSACAIVNPNLPNDPFPSKCIAGVGVIFYVMLALRAHLKHENWFARQDIPVPNMSQYLDLVALGTVADVVSLDKNNRILVYQGLRRICAGFARPGIVALLKIAGRDPLRTVTADLGFAVGPRLNAAGRLDDMSLGIACLLAENSVDAGRMAIQLNELNQERKAIEMAMREEAFALVKRINLTQQLPIALCLYEENWHQGIVGLVAAKIKDKLHRPVIAFAKTDNNVLKGSARSIEGLHIRDILDAIATQHPELICKFGGHAMAAGLSIAEQNLPAFSRAFNQEVSKHLSEQNLQNIMAVDGELDAQQINLETALLIQAAGPWGQGFPEPLFCGIFTLLEQRIVGDKHLKMSLRLSDLNYCFNAIAFNVNLEQWPNHHVKYIQVVYRLDINYFNGRQQLQLLIEDLKEYRQKETEHE